MKVISWTLSAGMLIVLSAAVRAQTPAATASPAGPKASGPILAGTSAGAARRQALLGAIEDWKTFLPENQADPLTKKYQPALKMIKDDATTLKTGEPVEPVEKLFEDWKQRLLTDLYGQNSQRFFSDPQRFSEFMQERLDTLAAIRNQKARAPQQIKQLDSLKAQVNTLPDRSVLDKIYDKMGASKTALHSAAIRLVSFTAPAAAFSLYSGAATSYSPDKLSPPPSAYTPVSYQGESASASTLSSIIASVSGTAKRYANQVAGAIVNFSRNAGLDEKLQASIIWAESAFNPHATSESGAMGLGQLMPKTASGLGVSNAYDIDQNVKGSSIFLKNLLNHFTTPEDNKYMQGLYAWGKDRVRSGQSVDSVWNDVFAKTPLSIKNAIASYNAGQGAIDNYAHGDYTKLPRSRTAYAAEHNVGYWQTVNYVPAVLRRYFEISLKTPSTPSAAAPIAI